ncbi:MAG: TRAP transporter small permease subunit [Alphaproteobacteria bacterium]
MRFIAGLERAVGALGLVTAAVLLPLLIGVRCYEIYVRKVANQPNALLNLIEGEAFLVLVFLTIGYAYLRDAHVRVDIVRDRVGPRARAWIELVGALLFMLPTGILLVIYGTERAASAYEDGERLALAFGGPYRWVLRATLPLGMGVFTAMVLTAAVRNLHFLATGKGGPAPTKPAP